MEVTIKTISDVQREAEFTLTNTELQPLFDNAYRKHAPKVELKGFRKGKVPMPMIKKMYGAAIEHDALDDIANNSFRSAMEERNVEPIGRPSMVESDFRRGEHFTFKIKYEVKPTIELKRYKGLEVERLVHTVGDKEIEQELERIRRVNASLLGVTLVRDDGDHIITADLQELADDGMPLIGKKSKDARFSLADETLASEIRDALKKSEVGGEYRVQFETRQGDHVHHNHVAISVKKIEKVELPDVDDAFVRRVTKEKVATKDEFLASMQKDLESYWAEQSERQLQDLLVKEIVTSHEFEVPESLVSLYMESYLEDIKSRTKDKRLPSDFDMKRFDDANREYASFQAKWGLLREQIIEREDLKVSEEELEELVAKDAPALGIEKEQLMKYYKSTGSVSERLLTTKLMNLLKGNATIRERVVEDSVAA